MIEQPGTILEAVIDLIQAICGVAVVLVVLRLRPRLSLSLHRRAAVAFAAVAGCFALMEVLFVVVLLAGLRGAWLGVVGEDVAEILLLAFILMGVLALYRADRRDVSELRRSADLDDLTGLPNRAFFRRVGGRRFVFSRENRLPLSCVAFDIDDFKPYNDQFGHEAGDRALECVADVLRESARAEDVAARYGGEEFVLLVNAEPWKAAEVAERIRRGVERRCSAGGEGGMRRQVTVSSGVAALSHDTPTLEDLVAAADREMYRAKRAGKNRVSVAEARKAS